MCIVCDYKVLKQECQMLAENGGQKRKKTAATFISTISFHTQPSTM